MAQRNLVGKDDLLFLDYDLSGNFALIICLTSQTYARVTEKIDQASKCGSSTGPGKQTEDISFEGQIMLEPDSGKLGIAILDDLWRAQTIVPFRWGKVTPVTGDRKYEGEAFIAELSETTSTDDATFSASLGISGPVTKTVTQIARRITEGGDVRITEASDTLVAVY